MPAQQNANVIALQLEKVRDKVPLLYERDDILSDDDSAARGRGERFLHETCACRCR